MQIMVCSLQVLPAPLTTKTSEETLFEKKMFLAFISDCFSKEQNSNKQWICGMAKELRHLQHLDVLD